MNKKRVNPTSYKFKNQKGQISVFVGLTFLILFTMFAMTINVGMVVHDKINLQNSVDFASIYVAQRQAEQLNAIAHMNYQIRQAHKLLSFRYVVLGTAGIDINGPTPTAGVEQNDETIFQYADKVSFPSCFASSILLNEIRADNWCKPSRFNGGFSGIPTLNVTNPFYPGNYGLQQTTVQLGSDIQTDAYKASLYNWWHTAFSMASFRLQVAYRKALVKALAVNLSKPINSNGMKDLYGESVFEGARKTFEYNLSESNRAAQNSNFQVKNSLEGINHSQWLPEIQTWIAPMYADLPTGGCNANGCVGGITRQFYYDFPLDYQNGYKVSVADAFFELVDPNGFLREFRSAVAPPGSDYQEILGFEKNPWYMVYNQVKASTTSNALFNPMRGTPMSAQAFSKPFGGRIGPWYRKNWPSGSNISTGSKTVELWSPRKVGSSQPPNLNDPTFLPDSPKYPNDTRGWKTHLALSSTGKIGNNPKISQQDYAEVVVNLFPSGNGNALAEGFMREREMAAVAPDLFDIYYYSIDSNFHENYLDGKLDRWLMQEAQFQDVQYSNSTIWRDLGFSLAAASNKKSFSIHNQLTQSTRQQLGPQVFFALESNDANGRANLLTSWVGGINVNEYRSPASGTVSSRFGKCRKFYSGGKVNVPGECIENGGRTGYSVKMVSKDYLTSSQHSLGNAGSSTGPILNPPQD